MAADGTSAARAVAVKLNNPARASTGSNRVCTVDSFGVLAERHLGVGYGEIGVRQREFLSTAPPVADGRRLLQPLGG